MASFSYSNPFTASAFSSIGGLFNRPATSKISRPPILLGKPKPPTLPSLPAVPSSSIPQLPLRPAQTAPGSSPASMAFPAIPGVNYTPIPNTSSYPTGAPVYVPPGGNVPNYSQYPSGTPGYAPPPTFQTQPIPQTTPTTTPGTTPPPAVAPPVPQSTPTSTAPAESTPTPTGAQTPTQKPPLPPDSPEAQRAYDSANKAYQEALRISPEEISTQEDIDRLLEQATKIRRSFQLGYENAQNQPIAMEFITGQQAAMERRALGQIGAAAESAEPLERKLARLQAVRTSALESSKFGLERAEKGIEREESRRRFGIEQAGAAETRGIAKSKAELDKAQADRQFEENKRQFGLDYAIKQRQATAEERRAGVSEREIAVKEKEAVGQTGMTSETGQALQLVNELIPKVDEISGVWRPGMFTGTGARFKQLTSILALNARKLIKGSGTVSDYEAKILSDSANALDTGYFSGRLSNNYVESELKKIRGVLNANAGQPVLVSVTDPSSGQVKTGTLTRDDIFSAASQGFIIEYQ